MQCIRHPDRSAINMLPDEQGITQPYCGYCMKWLTGEMTIPDESDECIIEPEEPDDEELDGDDWDDEGINDIND